MFERLISAGFQIEAVSHARAILAGDFPGAVEELETALLATTIPIEEIIAGGGGEHPGTQRLRRALDAVGWRKFQFVVERIINGVSRESQSHWIDHVREYDDDSRLALEIEWNNKDPFFDRDLESFKRLHADGAISVGIIVTRGASLQHEMPNLVHRFMKERRVESFEDLEQWLYSPTPKQRAWIQKVSSSSEPPTSFSSAFVMKFVRDKFGMATTHWDKLDERIRRGVGNPCPMVFIGLPASIVTFDEGKSALREVDADIKMAD